jgi:ComF family protein
MRGGEFCPECVSAPDKFMVDTLVVCSRYDKNGLLKKLIERFKYKFSKELSVSLGEILLSGAREFLNVPADSVVIPVPLHRKRFKYRGFNQAGEIAKALDGTWKISTTALKRVIYTPPQAHLNKEGRIKNLKDAFRVSSGMEAKLAGRTVILVDDVCTTGSTLNECAKVLRETGVVRIVALVLARGDRH